VKALVTNDGAKVVLRDYRDAKNGVRVVGREGTPELSLKPFADTNLTATAPTPVPLTPGGWVRANREDRRRGISYWTIPALLDFLLDNEHYAMWFGQTDKWYLVSLDKGTGEQVQDEQRLKELNRVAHDKAEALILEDQPTALRNLIGTIRNKAAKLVPSLGRTHKFHMSAETKTAYLFVAARRIASDRHYVEGLLTVPYQVILPYAGRTATGSCFGFASLNGCWVITC
jgi:hypothetical protein